MISNHGQDTGLYIPISHYSMLLSKAGNTYKEAKVMNRKCISYCLHLKSALFFLLTKPIVDILWISISIIHGKLEYEPSSNRKKKETQKPNLNKPNNTHKTYNIHRLE